MSHTARSSLRSLRAPLPAAHKYPELNRALSRTCCLRVREAPNILHLSHFQEHTAHSPPGRLLAIPLSLQGKPSKANSALRLPIELKLLFGFIEPPSLTAETGKKPELLARGIRRPETMSHTATCSPRTPRAAFPAAHK